MPIKYLKSVINLIILIQEINCNKIEQVNPKRSIMFEDNDVEPAPEVSCFHFNQWKT